MNPPFEPHPERRPATYFLMRSHEFRCVGCLQWYVGECPQTKYCKGRECQRVKALRAAERAKRRKG